MQSLPTVFEMYIQETINKWSGKLAGMGIQMLAIWQKLFSGDQLIMAGDLWEAYYLVLNLKQYQQRSLNMNLENMSN